MDAAASNNKDDKNASLDIERPQSRKDEKDADLAVSSVQERSRSPTDMSASLVKENERLKSQLREMEMELSRLKDSSSPSPTRRVVARRKGSGMSWNWLNSFQRAPQDDSDDENNVVFDRNSPSADREMVELASPTGLHHRHVSGSPQFKPLVQTDTLEIPPLKAKFSDLEAAESPDSARLPMELLTGDVDDESEISQPSFGNTNSQENETFRKQLQDRASWLVGLLVLQSCSSFIIKNNQDMLENHIVIVRFLTMLVGAGGNAGNQASVRVIRGLAVGTVNDETKRPYLREEAKMGLCLSAILGLAGCIRAAIFMTPLAETLAITLSLVSIVAISILIGALLPLGMHYINIDPAHSSTTIQVLMDIVGVTITVYVSGSILDSSFGAMLDAVASSSS